MRGEDVPEPAAQRLTLAREDVEFIDLLQRVASRWRLLGATALAAGACALGVTLIIPATYTASTSFVPELSGQRPLPSTLAGLAGQFGLSMTPAAAHSPRFYAEVIRSRALRERLLGTAFADPRPGAGRDSVPLLRLLRVRGRDSADSLENGLKRVRRLMAVEIDNQTRLVRVNVDSRFPALAAGIANRCVEYLNDFNAQTRQSHARELRKFIEGRVTEIERNLREAEDRLKRFYEANRSWQLSPELTFEEGRLRRQVDIAQELYVSLKREYESARIEEVNDTPVLTVIDPAVPPRRRSFPRPLDGLGLGIACGVLLAILWVLGADSWRRSGARP